MERVRISASELRGILATLAPQAGSRGKSHRPAPGPGLPAPPPSPPLPPPRSVRRTPESPRPFPQLWGRLAEGCPSPSPTIPGSVCGVPLGQLRPPSDESNSNACLRPLSYREGDCSPIAPVLLDSPWILNQKGVGAGVWWRPRGVSFTEQSSAGLPRHLFSSVGEKELGKLWREV